MHLLHLAHVVTANSGRNSENAPVDFPDISLLAAIASGCVSRPVAAVVGICGRLWPVSRRQPARPLRPGRTRAGDRQGIGARRISGADQDRPLPAPCSCGVGRKLPFPSRSRARGDKGGRKVATVADNIARRVATHTRVIPDGGLPGDRRARARGPTKSAGRSGQHRP